MKVLTQPNASPEPELSQKAVVGEVSIRIQ